jgi:ribokinase
VVGLSRLGVRTGYIGKVADDPEGRYIIDDLRREEVDTRGVAISDKGRSGVCIGFIDDTGERALYIDPGVNDTLKLDETQRSYAESSEFLHLTSFVGEQPFNTQKRLINSLKKPTVCVDPGEIYARKGLEALRPILKKTAVFLPNEREIAMLTGKSYRNGSKTLLEIGIEIVAVKLGERGCYVTDGKESQLIPPFPTKPRDTTGAGDAFCAGFIYGLLNHKDLYTCGRLGNFVASRCIRKLGTRDGLPSKLQLKI